LADSRRLSPNLAAGALLVVLAVALLLWQRPWQSSTSDDVVPVPDDAGSLLADQFRALSDADTQQEFVAAAGTGTTARTFATDAWDARTELDVAEVEMRYLRGGDVSDRADGSTLAEVAVSWRTGRDSAVTGTSVRDATVEFRLDPRPDGTFDVRSASAHDEPLPLWLAGRVAVERARGVRVITVDGGVPEIDSLAMARLARDQVREVVPGVDDDLTIVSPRTRSLAAGLTGRSPREIAPIAAVTTTVDGRSATARVIVLNPSQFAAMDARASQVVVNHEAAHLLTQAVGTNAEAWVAEGFADFVALHDDTAPLSLSAGQILSQVQKDGAPEALPSPDDFGGPGHGLGAVYESAWMIFRMLGENHSDATIVRFYRDVLAGADVDTAVRRAFDLSIRQLTAQWRDYLTKSASTVS
jgi:hypothetical protein